jgi:hypothetical protein
MRLDDIGASVCTTNRQARNRQSAEEIFAPSGAIEPRQSALWL